MPQFLKIDRKVKYTTPYMSDAFTILAWVKATSPGSASRQTIFSKTILAAGKDLVQFFLQSNTVNVAFSGKTAFSRSLASRDQTSNRISYLVSAWALLVTTYEALSFYRQIRIFVSANAGVAPDVDDLTVLDSNDFDDEISPTAVMYLGARMTSTGAVDGYEGYIANFQIWLGAHDIPSIVSDIEKVCPGCSICPADPAACLPSCPPSEQTASCLACPASCTNSCQAGQCWQCDTTCKTCVGTSAAQCISCRPYMSFTANVGCQCVSPYFQLSTVARCYQVLVRFDFLDPSEYPYEYSKAQPTSNLLGNFDSYYEVENPIFASQSRGLFFSGGQFVRISSLPAGSLRYAFSLSCFFRDLSVDGLRHTLFFKSSGSDVLHVYLSSRKLALGVQYTGQAYTTFLATAGHDNKWHHATVTYEKLDELTHWELFLDGISVQSQDYYDRIPEFVDPGTTAYIGSTGVGDGFQGFITAFSIYQGALQVADIAQILVDTACGCASGPCVRPSGLCLNLCAIDEYDAGGGVCSKCHVNCGPNVSCQDNSSCFDCPETCLTCKYTGTTTLCITCKVKSTMNAGTCSCSSPLSSFPDSHKCYSPWSDLQFGGRAGAFTPDLSAQNHNGILGGTINIYQRFTSPIAPKVMTDDRGVYFSSLGQFAHFNQESPFPDPVTTATTFELWVRSTGSFPGPLGVIFSVNSGLPGTNTIKLQLYVNASGYLAVEMPGVVTASSSLLDAQWKHVAVVYEDLPSSATSASPTLIVYVNGYRDFSQTCAAKFVSDPMALVLIGARYNASFFSKVDTFTGFISAVTVNAGAAGRFDVLRHRVATVCAAADAPCSHCPKPTGACINTCSAAEYYETNLCTPCMQTCVDGCYGPPGFGCLECHPSCLTCASTSVAAGTSAATECTSCSVHYAKLDPDPTIVGVSRPCKCQDGYFSAFDSSSKLRCLLLAREYRILEPRYPGAVETKQETTPAWHGDSDAAEATDPTPISSDRGLYFTGSTYLSLLSGRYMLECFTVTMWVRVDSFSSNGVIFHKRSSKRVIDHIGLQCKYISPDLICSYGCSDSTVALCSVSTPIAVAQWYHLALTYEQSLVSNEATLAILINGVPITSATCGFLFEEEETQPFTFGAEVISGSAAGFKGMLSLIQVWRGALYTEFIQKNLVTSACTGLCNGVCTVCPVCDECPLPFCVTCLNPAGCTSCILTPFKDNCDFGFYMDSTGACQSCVGCQGCSSTGCFKCFRPFCIECVTEYLNGCTKCAPGTTWDTTVKDCLVSSGLFLKSTSPLVIEPCSQPCLECVNVATYCTACVGNMQPQASGSCTCAQGWSAVALGCVQCATHCVKCLGSRPDQCVECDGTELWAMGATECECKSGYYLSTLGTCQACTKRCSRCTNGTFISCTACESPFTLFHNMCSDRNCTSTEFVSPSTNLCTPCAANCLTCEMSADLCTSCDTTQYYAGPHTCYACITTPGYHYPKNELHPQSSTVIDVCVEVCGDGLNYGQFQCDDGNLQDGDGCSSTCQIEEGYACVGGSHEFKDICKWTWPPVGFMKLGEYNKDVVSTQPITLEVEFSQKVVFFLKQDYITEMDVDLRITNITEFSWRITTKDKQTYTVELNSKVPLTPQHQARLLFFDKSLIQNSVGQPLYNHSLLCNLTDFRPWTDNWDTVVQSINVAGHFHLAFTLIVVAIAVGFQWAMGRPTGTAWRYLEVSQYLHIVRLQKVNFPWQLRLFFQMFSWSNFSFLPNLFSHITSDSQPTSQHFQDHGLPSALFLISAGPAIELLLLSLLGYFALCTVNRVLRLRKNCVLRSAEKQYWFQGVIRSLLLGSPMILLAAGLQAPVVSAATLFQASCALLSYICLIGGYAAGIAASCFLATLTPAVSESPAIRVKLSLLFEEHKQDSVTTRCFLVLYYLRRANLSLALAFLVPTPTVQAYILALNSLALTIVQAKIAPYRRKWSGNALNYVTDLVVTIAHFLFLGFGVWSEHIAEVVGWALVLMLGGVVVGHFVAMAKDQLSNVRFILKRYKTLTRVGVLKEITAVHDISTIDQSKIFL